jgi:hypothetical protein
LVERLKESPARLAKRGFAVNQDGIARSPLDLLALPGVDWAAPGNCYWRHDVTRNAAARITLLGASEFEAEGVELRGDVAVEVPDGPRMRVSPGDDPNGPPRVELTPLAGGRASWRWEYALGADGAVILTMKIE